MLAALVLEQVLPCARQSRPPRFAVHLHFLDGQFNGGQHRHGVIACCWRCCRSRVGSGVYHALYGMSPVAAWLGTLRCSTSPWLPPVPPLLYPRSAALRAGELAPAREMAREMAQRSALDTTPARSARGAIEQGCRLHRQVTHSALFRCAGPAAPCSTMHPLRLADQWVRAPIRNPSEFGRFAARAFHWIAGCRHGRPPRALRRRRLRGRDLLLAHPWPPRGPRSRTHPTRGRRWGAGRGLAIRGTRWQPALPPRAGPGRRSGRGHMQHATGSSGAPSCCGCFDPARESRSRPA